MRPCCRPLTLRLRPIGNLPYRIHDPAVNRTVRRDHAFVAGEESRCRKVERDAVPIGDACDRLFDNERSGRLIQSELRTAEQADLDTPSLDEGQSHDVLITANEPLGATPQRPEPCVRVATVRGLQGPALCLASDAPLVLEGAHVRDHGWRPIASRHDVRRWRRLVRRLHAGDS